MSWCYSYPPLAPPYTPPIPVRGTTTFLLLTKKLAFEQWIAGKEGKGCRSRGDALPLKKKNITMTFLLKAVYSPR